jgi:hypothetical protein
VLSNPTARLRPQTSNTPGILQTKTQPPPKPYTTTHMHIIPRIQSRISQQAVQPIRAHAPNQNRAPQKAAEESRDTLKPCVCPQASSAPKYSTLDDRQFTPRTPGSVPLRARKRPYRGFSSAWSFRPWVQAPLGTSLPRVSPAVPPSIYLGRWRVMEQTSVDIEVDAPSHEVSLIIKSCHQEGEFDGQSWHPHYHRESVFRCSPLMWSCYNPSIHILPLHGPKTP